MSDELGAFEHQSDFEYGERGGTIKVGKFQQQYEELFAEVLEDGIITQEERQRLDRAADAMGLDRSRLARLEEALQAAYESRHQIKIRDLSEPTIREMGDDSPRPSLRVPSSDPTTNALRDRVRELEKEVKRLQAELAEARAAAAVEVDLSDMDVSGGGSAGDPAELERQLRHNPRDDGALSALYYHFLDEGDNDRAYCMAQVLHYLDKANPEQRTLAIEGAPQGLVQPKQALSQEGWKGLLFHPEEEVLTGDIFSIIVSAVLLGRVSALRRDGKLPALDPEKKQVPETSTIQAVRCFKWAASLLGMYAPAFYTDTSYAGLVQMVPGMPPSSRLGKQALSGRKPKELAFVAGRHLSWYRQEHFVRLLVPSIQDLEDLFLCAIMIGNPSIPLSPAMKTRVAPLAQAIEPLLEPTQIDHLRGYLLRFVGEGGRTNLQRWASSADFTASRAGFLLCDDLSAAEAMLKLEAPSQLEERMTDLLVFATGTRYARLRKQLGIAN